MTGLPGSRPSARPGSKIGETILRPSPRARRPCASRRAGVDPRQFAEGAVQRVGTVCRVVAGVDGSGIREKHGLSEPRASRIVGPHRGMQRFVSPVLADVGRLTRAIAAPASAYGRHGHSRFTAPKPTRGSSTTRPALGSCPRLISAFSGQADPLGGNDPKLAGPGRSRRTAPWTPDLRGQAGCSSHRISGTPIRTKRRFQWHMDGSYTPTCRWTPPTGAPFFDCRRARAGYPFVKSLRGMASTLLQGSGYPEEPALGADRFGGSRSRTWEPVARNFAYANLAVDRMLGWPSCHARRGPPSDLARSGRAGPCERSCPTPGS